MERVHQVRRSFLRGRAVHGRLHIRPDHLQYDQQGHGQFDPATFDDRYEAALEELVKAKIEGKSLPRPRKVEVSKPNDLLAALRESAGMMKSADDKPKRTAANANKGAGRERAARGAAAKSASPKAAPQRKAG